jgi:hypothetical protein
MASVSMSITALLDPPGSSLVGRYAMRPITKLLVANRSETAARDLAARAV